MLRLFAIVALVMLLNAAVYADTFEGRVLSEDGQPLVGATIRLSDGNISVTDEDGRFVIEGEDGSELSVTHVGYRAFSGLKLAEGGEITIGMTPSMSVLDKVVVTGNRFEKAAYKVSQPIQAGQTSRPRQRLSSDLRFSRDRRARPFSQAEEKHIAGNLRCVFRVGPV